MSENQKKAQQESEKVESNRHSTAAATAQMAPSEAGRTVTARAQVVSLSQIILLKHLERGAAHPAERCHCSWSEASARTTPAAASEKPKLMGKKRWSHPRAARTATRLFVSRVALH